MTIHVFHPVVFPSRRDWKLSDVEIGEDHPKGL
jgi:hypothetical protein